MHRPSWRLVAALACTALSACHPEFELKNLTSNDALYSASFAEFKRHHWDNAIAGFEKLTTDLPARDTLLPRSYWYLASAHDHQEEHLLAAQSFSRLVESFPEDTLADDAALEAARSYRKLWRKPELDATYGQTALASYNTLVGLYPTSPLIPAAQREIDTLENWFALKDYAAGMYYLRRKAFDSGILYFKDVITKHPTSPTARMAALRLVEAFKGNKDSEGTSELCGEIVQRYPNDPESRNACRGIKIVSPKSDSAATTSSTTSAPPLPPPPIPPRPPAR